MFTHAYVCCVRFILFNLRHCSKPGVAAKRPVHVMFGCTKKLILYVELYNKGKYCGGEQIGLVSPRDFNIMHILCKMVDGMDLELRSK